MRRKTLWTVVGLVAIVLVVVAAGACFRRGHDWHRRGWHHGGPLSYVARELKLSGTQISQVRSIWGEERPTVAALLKSMDDGAHQMADATAGGKFDEEKIHAIAAAEGDAFAGLMVEKEHFQERIYSAVLNEEQRQSADRLQRRGLDRLDHVVARLQRQSQ